MDNFGIKVNYKSTNNMILNYIENIKQFNYFSYCSK